MITMFAHADGTAEQLVLKTIRDNQKTSDTEAASQAAEIVEKVRSGGYEAVCACSLELDKAEPRELDPQELEDAVDRLEPAVLRALEHAAKNLYDYHTRMLQKTQLCESPIVGGNVGELVRGLGTVAVYVPGGDVGGASSVLMNAIPARVAGVEEIVLVTPPCEALSDVLLAAAWVAGVDRVFTLGGAQAVAALAYGAGPIPKADKLVGEGEAVVQAAKRLVADEIDVDWLRRAPDLCVIADEAADPVWAAADLLSQAEHSETSSAVLLTASETLAEQVMEELERQSGALRRKSVMQKALKDCGAVIVCEDVHACVELANSIAPSQLELMTAAPLALLDDVKNAGCIYLGAHSPQALGEYAAGICHSLPAAGAAAWQSPLSVNDFVKKTSVVKFNDEALEKLSGDIMAMARAEALTAHANALKVRFSK